jgi:pimeloyl-ACP methyl ester carboxylesterase
VRKLVVVSAAARSDGQYPEVLAAFDAMPAQAPMFAESLRASPLGAMYPDADWEAIFTKVGEEVRTGFDWTQDLAKVTAQTMLVFADADSIRPEHMVEMWKAIGGGQRDAGLDGSLRPGGRLAILPGATHYDVLSSPLFLPAVIAFLDAPPPAGN